MAPGQSHRLPEHNARALWMRLVSYAHYKRERARQAGKLDEAKQLLEAVDLLWRYDGERDLHAIRVFGLTVH